MAQSRCSFIIRVRKDRECSLIFDALWFHFKKFFLVSLVCCCPDLLFSVEHFSFRVVLYRTDVPRIVMFFGGGPHYIALVRPGEWRIDLDFDTESVGLLFPFFLVVGWIGRL